MEKNDCGWARIGAKPERLSRNGWEGMFCPGERAVVGSGCLRRGYPLGEGAGGAENGKPFGCNAAAHVIPRTRKTFGDIDVCPYAFSPRTHARTRPAATCDVSLEFC